MNDFYEYKGAIHIHSRFSDGSGSVKEIVQLAQKADLDFIIITDHNTLKAQYEGWERWYDKTLLLVGNEISPRYGNHYLAFRSQIELKANQFKKPQEMIDAANQNDGFGFLAHPVSKARPLMGLKDYSWHDWSVAHYSGIELWSYMHDWIKNITPLNLMRYYLHPEETISGPPAEMLEKWDLLSAQRRVVAIGGIDAHAKPVPVFSFIKVLPYEYLFKTIRTHIFVREKLSGHTPDDMQLIYDALRSGHCYVGYDLLADATGFSFMAMAMSGQKLLGFMGDEMELKQVKEEIAFQVSCPKISTIRLLKDGKPVKVTESNQLLYTTGESGVYRVEVYYDNTPWIFSNPIYVR